MRSLELARTQFMMDIRGDGTHCPCCDRWGKVNSRTLNKTMARSLVWLVRASAQSDDEWVDVPLTAPKELLRTNQLSTLKHWDLIEKMANKDPKTKSSGIWRPTHKGKRFVMGLNAVQEKVYIYNDIAIDFGGDLIVISDVYEGFHYGKMMGDSYE